MRAILGRLRGPTAARVWKWPSRKDAEKAVETLIPWKTWDQDVRRIFIVSLYISHDGTFFYDMASKGVRYDSRIRRL